MLGLEEAAYWRLTPRAFHALVVTHERRAAQTTEHQRQVLQWTVGVALEYVLQALRAKKESGSAWEPADFYRLPRRAELQETPDDDGRHALQVMALFTAGRGGTIPPQVEQALRRS